MQIAPPRQLPVRIVGGLVLGFLIWGAGGALYHPLVAATSGWLIRAFENPGVTRIVWSEGNAVVNRDDFPPSSPRPSLPVGDQTFNIILLTVLFAVAPRPLSDRNVPRFLIAACALFPFHVFSLIAEVESIYAMRLGMWSTVNYGPWARNFWATSAHFYDVVGVHAIAVGLWLAFSPREDGATRLEKKVKGSKRGRR